MARQRRPGNDPEFPGRNPLSPGAGGSRHELDGETGEVAGRTLAPATVSADGRFTFHHDLIEPGEHYFYVQDREEREAGYAHVLEKPAATKTGAAHVLTQRLYAQPVHRGNGLGSHRYCA